MVDPRDRDGADDPEAGAGAEGADEPDSGSSDWFYQQLSGGRRLAREAAAAASAKDEEETPHAPKPAVEPPTVAFEPPTVAFEPPITEPVPPTFDPQFPDVTSPFTPSQPTQAAPPTTTWSILEVPVTPAEPPKPVSPAESKPQTGPIFEPGAPFVWNLKPGVGSDPLVEPAAAAAEPAAPTPAEAEPAAPAPAGAGPTAPAPAGAASESLTPAEPLTTDEFAPPTRAFQPPAYDVGAVAPTSAVPPTPAVAPTSAVPPTPAVPPPSAAPPAEPAPQTPPPWSPAPLIPPVASGATPAGDKADETDGDGHGLAALLGMFDEAEPEPAAPEGDRPATDTADVTSGQDHREIPPMAPAFFEPAPLVPPGFAVPVVPAVPPAPPTVPVEAPRFPAMPGLVSPPFGATPAEPSHRAEPASAFDEEDDDEGIDDLAAPPYDEAAARAASADTATVLMDAAAIEAVRADAPEPAEEATLLMGAIPSPATQALDAESLADASAPTAAMAPASAAAAAAAAGPDEVLPTSRRSRGKNPPGETPPGGRPPGSPGNNRILFWVAGGLVALLILIGLFVFGTRLPGMLTGGAPTSSPAQTTKATPKPTPTPTPKPTVIAKPGAPQPAGVAKWSTLGGGECIQPFTTPWAETFTIVDCGTPHTAQMVYTNLFSADPAAPYPGAPALANQINLLCTKPGVINLQAASAYPDLQLQGTYPATAQQWADGLRSYYCFASRSSGQPITGSVAGPGPQG